MAVRVVPLQSAPSSASTDAVSARSRPIAAFSRSRLAESSEHFVAAFGSPSSGWPSVVPETAKTGKYPTKRAASSTRDTAADRANPTCMIWSIQYF
jgi:hypothetical protein